MMSMSELSIHFLLEAKQYLPIYISREWLWQCDKIMRHDLSYFIKMINRCSNKSNIYDSDITQCNIRLRNCQLCRLHHETASFEYKWYFNVDIIYILHRNSKILNLYVKVRVSSTLLTNRPNRCFPLTVTQ